MDNKVNLQLTNEEALVLFDFLSRFNELNNYKNFEDDAEQKLLWIIEAQLEKMLSVQLKDNYKGLLLQAREDINKKY